MASTYSTNLALELIGTGEQSGTWGTTTNTNLGTSLIVPANKKMYFIFNNTSGGFAVTVKVSGQTGILVPNGKKVVLTCNGTDIVEAHTAIVGNATMGGTLGVTGATTLSSTLGVTGVATLGNGAILGTPASGTVTNLTGTASININGTVGATTPATGAFTTLSATGAFTGTTGAFSTSLTVTAAGPTFFTATPTTGTNRVQLVAYNTGVTMVTGVESSAGGAVFTGAPAYAAVFGNLSATATCFATNSTTRMLIDSSGNVGIGTISPSAKLHSYATSGTTTTLGRFEAAIGSYTGTSLIAANTLGASSTYNLFSCITDSDGDAGGPFTQFLVRGDGNVGIGVTSPACILDISGATGGQIKFPATQNASTDANTLDDYEEGTWTPTISGHVSAGAGTYTVQTATYTKVGRTVHVQANITWTAHTGTGNIRLSALPFTVMAGAGNYGSFSIGLLDNVAFTAGNYATAWTNINSTNVILQQTPTGGGVGAEVPMDTAGTIIYSGTYFV